MDSRLSKVINMIRSRHGDLQESPTMSAGAGGFTSAAAATGPVAGYDPVLNIIDRRKKKKKVIGLGPGSRKRWMNNDG